MTRALSEDELIELNALVDGELEPAVASTLVQRIATDAALREARDTIVAGREAIRGLERPVVSDELRRRVLSLTELEETGAPRRDLARRRFDGWRNIAATIVVTALVASGATYMLALPRTASLDDLVASGHRRSLLAASPVDVLSSDRHTVKPWLDARLGVSPPAPDLAPQGYPLIGGRAEVVAQQPVPVLVYRHNEHTISLVAVPVDTGDSAPVDMASGGFNMVRWRGKGFEFRAVSDLEPDELNTFVSDYQRATGGNGR
jgi:anti-sigma factor RsiW